MLAEDVPIGLANTVACFAATDGCKFKRTMNECVGVGNIQPLPKGKEIMSPGIII